MKRITKRISLGLALAFMAASQLFAAKARPATVSLTLTDGSVVSARLVGDEYLHYYQMLDGTPLKKTADGKYEATTYEAIMGGQVLNGRGSRASDIGSSTPSYFPHTGSPKALVILVQFQDVKFKTPSPYDTFNHYLNGKKGESMPEADKDVFITDEEACQNYGSVSQYFADMSDNQFTPQFDIVGPVTVSKNSAYYGRNGSGNNNDLHYTEMIKEACQLVDGQMNFADYDSDNDGCVDLVYIIYAGYAESESGNSDDCLWPKSGTAAKLGTYDGKTVYRFGINNELNKTPDSTANREDGKLYIGGIGLFCHEFSHCLGLPDHYPVSSPATSQNNQSPEYWDVMDMGCYCADGYRPIPYSPWEKSIMGWVQPTTLPATQAQQITLEPYDLASKSLKIEADDESGEYLLLQNIRNEGWYKYAYGYGLLVWRIDYADMEHVGLFDYPNDMAGKSRVMVVPADGLLINSYNQGEGREYSGSDYVISLMNDPFPAYANNRTDGGGDVDSLVEVKLNHGTLTTRPLYNIKKDETTGLVTFDYLKNYATAISPAIVADEDNTPTEYYDLEGRRIDSPRRGQLYITGKGEKIIYQ